MNVRLFTIAAAGLLFLAADAPDDATKKDQEKIQGTWKAESMQRNGKDAPAEIVAKRRLTFDGDKLITENVDAKGHFKLDATKNPATIDLIGDGKKSPGTVHGIYKLDGDTLTIAFPDPGKDHPTEFVSKPDSGVGVIVLKREKK